MVNVRVELNWGLEWCPIGRYMKMTVGRGFYVTVSECQPYGAGFRGCPLGRGESVDEALRDFVRRGAEEYLGMGPLTVRMLRVVETRDNRN